MCLVLMSTKDRSIQLDVANWPSVAIMRLRYQNAVEHGSRMHRHMTSSWLGGTGCWRLQFRWRRSRLRMKVLRPGSCWTMSKRLHSRHPGADWILKLAKKWPFWLWEASLMDGPLPELMWWKNELLLVLWQLSMSGFSLKLFVCCSIPVMMFVISYMHDYACYVSCILVHSLYQLIQTNLTWAAQCWTILGQTNVFTWFIAQNINTDNIPACWGQDLLRAELLQCSKKARESHLYLCQSCKHTCRNPK